MSLSQLHHVQLAMPAGGEERARAFYAGLLGLPEVPKPAALAGRGGLWFEQGPLRVHLGVEAGFRPARKAHPALQSLDFAGLLARLRAAGVEVRPAEELGGRRRAFVDDPFGNRLELLEDHPAQFAVIYRWELDPAREADFVEAWAAMTELIVRERGGLGSRLHRLGPGQWLAYAQWPDRRSWLASQEQGSPDAALSARMQAAVLDQDEPLELEGICDRLLPVHCQEAH